jgi:hypothetical protein
MEDFGKYGSDTENAYQQHPGGQFRPGNPGKPRGARNLSTILFEAIQKAPEGQDGSYSVDIVNTLLRKAKNGDMRAIEFVFDRLEGKAVNRFQYHDSGESTLTPERKAQLDRLLQDARKV